MSETEAILSPPTLFNPNIPEHMAFLSDFAGIHAACIETDFTIASFLPPLDLPSILQYWQDRVTEVSKDMQDIVFVMAQHAAINGALAREEVAGFCVLSCRSEQTGPFRGDVEKLLVSPKYRKRGIAKAVMMKLEERAIEKGRTLLVSDKSDLYTQKRTIWCLFQQSD